jgi:hypothetical protein
MYSSRYAFKRFNMNIDIADVRHDHSVSGNNRNRGRECMLIRK